MFASRWLRLQWLSGLKDPSVLSFLPSNFLGRLWLPCPQIFPAVFFCPLTPNPNWKDSYCGSAVESETTWGGVAFCTSLFDFLKTRGRYGGWSWKVANTPKPLCGNFKSYNKLDQEALYHRETKASSNNEQPNKQQTNHKVQLTEWLRNQQDLNPIFKSNPEHSTWRQPVCIPAILGSYEKHKENVSSIKMFRQDVYLPPKDRSLDIK